MTMRCIVLFLILLFSAGSPLVADADDKVQDVRPHFTDVDVSAPVDVTNSVTTEVVNSMTGGSNAMTNKPRAYAFALGDVDINQCYRSWSLLIGQFTQVNWFCIADSLDAKGLHEAAAEVRCSQRGYAKKIGGNCIERSLMTAVTVPPPPPPPVIDRDDEEVEALSRQLAELRMQLTEQQAILEKAQQQKPPPPIVKEVVVQDDGAARRAKALAILEGRKVDE